MRPERSAQVEGKRRIEIADIKLLRVAAATHLAALAGSAQQVRRKAQHVCGNGPSLRFVGREQCRRRAAQHSGQLPAKIVGVLHAGVQALPSGRRVNVRGIAGKETPARPGSDRPGARS